MPSHRRFRASFRFLGADSLEEALLEADAESATVTLIATGQGFWELGKFAVAYRSLFGESPSATLRRRPDDLPSPQGSPFALPSAVSA